MSEKIDITIDSSIDVEAGNEIVSTSSDNNIDIEILEPYYNVTINKREYVITGDNMYIPKTYDESPQWLKDIIGTITDFSLNQKLTEIGALSNTLYGLIDELNVAKNTYTNSIITSADIDERINARVETLNSNIASSNATIVDLISTRATPTEASSLALNVLTASINDGAISSLVSNLQTAISTGNGTLANNIDIVSGRMTGEFEANAEVIDIMQAYVGIDEAGASTGTGVSAYLEGSNGVIGSADSKVANNVYVDGNGNTRSKFEYNSSLNIGGTSYNSGFGLATSLTNGSIPVGQSEFWINASKFKFTNTNQTGQVAPFTIDATETTPQVTFNGVVSFTNIKNDAAKTALIKSISDAQDDANSALNEIEYIASDNKLTPIEKSSTKKEWDTIVSEYTKNIAQATLYAVSSTAYTTAYNALDTYLNTVITTGVPALLASLTTTSDIVGSIFRLNFKAYYDAKVDLLNAISTKINGNIDISIKNADNNKIKHSWTTGSGSTGIFNMNGLATENYRVYADNHNGERVVVWECRPNSASDPDGGWNTSSFEIDRTKTYRYSVFVRTSANTGSTYLGCGGNTVANLNTTTKNTNPYFWSGTLPTQNEWYLIVGYVYPSGQTGLSHKGGIYSCEDGKKVSTITDFNWASDATTGLHRCYHYYDTVTTTRQWMWSPRVDIIDGNEPSIIDLIGKADVSSGIDSNNDVFAQKLGYASYSAMVTAAANGKTIINGGYINTGLIQANAIVANQINTTGLIAENISANEIVGKTLTGTVINGARINGSVIKASYLDLDGELEVLTNYHISVAMYNANPSLYTDAVYISADNEYRIPSISTISSLEKVVSSSSSPWVAVGSYTLSSGLYSYATANVGHNMKAVKSRPSIINFSESGYSGGLSSNTLYSAVFDGTTSGYFKFSIGNLLILSLTISNTSVSYSGLVGSGSIAATVGGTTTVNLSYCGMSFVVNRAAFYGMRITVAYLGNTNMSINSDWTSSQIYVTSNSVLNPSGENTLIGLRLPAILINNMI